MDEIKDACGDCRFYTGRCCVRHAPIGIDDIGRGKFPVMDSYSDWCGDFELSTEDRPWGTGRIRSDTSGE